MNYLNNEEMYAVDGGAVRFKLWYIVGGVVTFLIGVFGGLTNPRACKR